MEGNAVFDLDRFIAECRAAVSLDPSHKSVREIVARAVSEPAAVIAGLGAPAHADVQKLYSSSELTVLNVIWGPGMTIMPHNHLMWAGDRHLHGARGQHLLAPPAGRGWRPHRSRRGKVAGGTGCRAARARHHLYRNQPAAAIDGRHPCLWRGFLC